MLHETFFDFTVFFQSAEEGGFIVTVPALPGCVTQGETFEHAQEMAKDAIQAYIESLLKEGEEIPNDQVEIISHVRIKAEPA